VLDADGRPVGVATRAKMRARNLRHRVVFVVVRSSSAEILLHRRSDAKDLWPGRWDLAVGGVLTAGEGWFSAAARELEEELGVAGELAELGGGNYRDGYVDVVGRVFTVTHDGPFRFADGEVVEARFITLSELPASLRANAFCADSVALVTPLVL